VTVKIETGSFIEACREWFREAATRDLVVIVIGSLAGKEGEQWAQRFGDGLAALRVLMKTYGPPVMLGTSQLAN
jgi:hypothetical protein